VDFFKTSEQEEKTVKSVLLAVGSAIIFGLLVAGYVALENGRLTPAEMMVAVGGNEGTHCEKCPGSASGCTDSDLQGGQGACADHSLGNCNDTYDVSTVMTRHDGSCSTTETFGDLCCWYTPTTCKKTECVIVGTNCNPSTTVVNIQHNRCLPNENC